MTRKRCYVAVFGACLILVSVRAFAQEAMPPQPTETVVLPSDVPAPPAVAQSTPAPQTDTPAGQWTYTQQYGWVWMPYGQNYTYVDPNADVAQMYVYRVSLGWSWVLAPWVFGIGPTPSWGTYGCSSFAWYSRPWFHARYNGGGYDWGHSGGRAYYGNRGISGYRNGSVFHYGGWNRGAYGGHTGGFGGYVGSFGGGYFGGDHFGGARSGGGGFRGGHVGSARFGGGGFGGGHAGGGHHR